MVSKAMGMQFLTMLTVHEWPGHFTTVTICVLTALIVDVQRTPPLALSKLHVSFDIKAENEQLPHLLLYMFAQQDSKHICSTKIEQGLAIDAGEYCL